MRRSSMHRRAASSPAKRCPDNIASSARQRCASGSASGAAAVRSRRARNKSRRPPRGSLAAPRRWRSSPIRRRNRSPRAHAPRDTLLPARADMTISRRVLLGRFGAVMGAAALVPRTAAAQGAQAVPPPPTFDTHRDYNPTADPVSYPDPDIITIDPAFNALRVNNSAIHRLWTGGMWSEGPAWCSQGKYLVWSDVPMGVQRRWIDDDGRVTVFRNPSNNSNGNTYDFQGRQVTCEHTGRRISRYEHDGSITAIAETYMGQRLNSPNDVAPHRDGSYWFTDPAAGFTLYEGAPEVTGGTTNAEGHYNSRAGQVIGVGNAKREIMTANVYRVDPQSGRDD